MKIVSLICHGVFDADKKLLKKPLIAVDGGLNLLHELKVEPDLIVGDLDSVEDEILEAFSTVPTRKYPSDKDVSDTEIAIEIAFNEMGADKVILYGGFGKRVDHSLYNIALLRRYPERLVMHSGIEEAFVLKKSHSFQLAVGTTLSLIPLTDRVTSVTTQGLKWELKNATLTKEKMSLSNLTTEENIQIHFSEGELLLTQIATQCCQLKQYY